MNQRKFFQTIAIVVLAFGTGASGESSLTIYNQNFAVVREQVPLDLKAGSNEVRVTQITAHVEPDSVILRDPQGKRALQILEQNYRADPISQGLLLSLYEGKEIDFLVRKNDGKDEIVRGRIIRSGYVPHQSGMQQYGEAYRMSQMRMAQGSSGQSIVEVDGRLRFSLPGEPLFPSLADDAILKPTIHWLLETDKAGKLDAELSYVTGGMSWEADYNMLAGDKDDTIDVIGWVTMDNQSGRTFENAQIKLMAGDVSKIQPEQRAALYAMAEADYAGGMGPAPVSEKAFDEYHLYTLARATTLHDRETKQVEFLRAEGVRSQRLYVYDGAKIDRNRYRGSRDLRNEREYGTQSNPKVWVMREFKNSQDNRLGIPLPKGRVRFYRQDDDGRHEFTGENVIDHTPRDETVRLYTGDAFDLVGERRRTNYQIDMSRNWLDESFEIKLRNRKEQGTVEVRVVEHLYRWSTWEIVEKSNTFLKTDSQTIEFRIQVPAGEEKVITYKVHYTW
ncbi:MAG: DUF4139 domain-containing protein [Phycisphaerae bacterium]|nr:DUF4139 domain-containing protein [Phycisphaerae bacterium]